MSETEKTSQKRKSTIGTVAARAGVAVGIGSRFLNGHKAGKEAGARSQMLYWNQAADIVAAPK